MPTCSFKNCPRAAIARGLCGSHYRQQARGRALTPLKGASGQISEELMERLSVRLPVRIIEALGPEPSVRLRELLGRLLDIEDRMAARVAKRSKPCR